MAAVSFGYASEHAHKRQDKQTHQKKGAKKKLKQKEAMDKLPPLTNYDIFADHWLVDSPRRITREKTRAVLKTDLSDALELFYANIVTIPERKLDAAVSKCKEISNYIYNKVSKLALQHGLKIQGMKYACSAFDETHVISPSQFDVFITFDNLKTKPESTESGYFVLPIKRYKEGPGEPPDAFRFGRSDDSLHISSMTVAKLMHHLVEKALRVHTKAKVQPFIIQQNSSQIVVHYKDKYQLNIIPATYIQGERIYLITRPYAHDDYPASHLLWRSSYVEKEREILSRIDSADRGVRRKAFRLLKALVQVEPTLQGLTSYHIKTILLHTFDNTIDHTPRWQRESVESAFLDLLSHLQDYLASRSLPHFFIRGYNLFGNMETRRLASLQTRVGFLLYNQQETVRILHKRSLKIPPISKPVKIDHRRSLDRVKPSTQ